MAKFLDNCRFTPTAGGTGDWVYSSAITGAQSPTAAGAIDGATYRYSALSSDSSQWEIGYGAYTSSTGTFARTTVLFNSSGTTSKISFSSAPTVGIVPLGEDFREKLDAARTYYVGAVVGAPTITIATPAVVSLTTHGLTTNDPVVFSVLQNRTACTITAASPAVISMTNTFAANRPVVFSSTGYLPTGLTAGTTYYVIATGLSGSSFQVSATVGGAAVATTAVTATFTNGSATITAGATDNLVVGQIVRFAGTSVINFSNATDYYVISTPSGTTFTVSATNGGTAITAGAVTSNGTLVQAGTHYCSTTGALPTGITEGTTYYVISAGLTANAFEISASVGGAAINTSGSVTGTPVYSVYTGNDTNTGLAQTRAGAFLTVQRAYDVINSTLDFGGQDVAVQIASGTYAPAGGTPILSFTKPWSGGGSLSFTGDTTTPSNVVFNATSNACVVAATVFPGNITLQGMKFTTTTTGGAISHQAVGTIYVGNVEFGAMAGGQYHIFITGAAASISHTSNYTISGTAGAHWATQNGGVVACVSRAISLIGTPAINIFAFASRLSEQEIYNNTFPGAATGTRYYVSDNSVVFTNGGGATYVPGNVTGSSLTGGQYV